MTFDASAATQRLERLWQLQARFGMERGAYHCYLNEIVSDRYTLINGLQLLRDELQLASVHEKSDIAACGADLSVPSVITTLAHTNCGDRIHQGETTKAYERVVGSRFATLSEIGELKIESFSPTGGGTDDGATLAHVTVAHQLDEPLRRRVYQGNDRSFVLACIDLKAHVGRRDDGRGGVDYGHTEESPWRKPRAACGAIVGALASYDPDNGVHRRIREDLGEDNFAYLSGHRVVTGEGADITALIAAAIVAIQGLRNTAEALASELDERGLGHLTASLTVNRPAMSDPVIYLARATVFAGVLRLQGFGTDARAYAGRMVEHHRDGRLQLSYAGRTGAAFPVEERAGDLIRPPRHAPYDI